MTSFLRGASPPRKILDPPQYEQSLSFPSPLEVTEFFSFWVPPAEDFRKKTRLLVVYFFSEIYSYKYREINVVKNMYARSSPPGASGTQWLIWGLEQFIADKISRGTSPKRRKWIWHENQWAYCKMETVLIVTVIPWEVTASFKVLESLLSKSEI